jgi:hypothetical protein
MGGATLRNVVVLILEDGASRSAWAAKRTRSTRSSATPCFQALGAITFLREGVFEAGAAALQNAAGTRMYMKLLTPVIECGVEGKELPFTFDTGASGSSLSARYYKRFRAEAGSWKKGENTSGGAGGIVRRKIYLQAKLDLTIGDATATLENVSVFPEKMDSDLDELFGNLGQDMVARFEGFTLDFSKMAFSLGPPLAAGSAH